jgi:hypothetical protein
MSERIAVLYSLSPHFLRAVEVIRRERPGCHLTVVVPPSFPQALLEGKVEEIVVLAPTHEQRRSLRQGLKLLRFLRRESFDLLVVLFNSPPLVLISTLSGARERAYISPDGKERPLSFSFLRVFLSMVRRRIKGQYTYYKIWWYIRRHPIDVQDSGESTEDMNQSSNGKEQGGSPCH